MIGCEWGGWKPGVLDTKPELSPAPSASARTGKGGKQCGPERVGKGVRGGGGSGIQGTPNPVSGTAGAS